MIEQYLMSRYVQAEGLVIIHELYFAALYI